MRNTGTLVAILAALALTACDPYTPLPADKATYAGDWRGSGISLVIEPGGRVVYAKKEGTASKSIDSPIKEFKGDNFIVGVSFITTEFVVSKPPHEDEGEWKMTVDGIELTRMPPGTEPLEREESST